MKMAAIPFQRRVVLCLIIIAPVLLLVFKSISYSANQTLESLQSDVVRAKEKQADILSRSASVEQALEKQKSEFLNSESNRLLGEVSKEKDQILEHVQKQIAEERPNLIQTPKDGISEAREIHSTATFSRAWNRRPSERYGPMPEAEVVYKVAISDNLITLREAVEIGEAGNMQLRSLRAKVEAAASKVTEAKRAMFPTVQLAGEVNGGIAPGGKRFYKGGNYKLNVNQPLYYGGELVLTVKQAEESLKAAKYEFEKTRNEYVHQVRTSYYGVVKAEYNVQYQWEVFAKADEIYRRLKKEREERLVTEVDFLNVESQYFQIYFQVESGRNDLSTADVLLHQTINIDADLSLPIDLKLHFSKRAVSFERMVELSERMNPDIMMKTANADSGRYGRDVFKAKRKPRFDLRGSVGKLGEVYKDSQAIEEEENDLKLRPEWFLGVHGSMPIGASTVEYEQVKHVFGPTISAYQGSEDWSHKFKLNLFDNLANITDEKSAVSTMWQSEFELKKSKDDVYAKLREDFYTLQKSLIQMDSTMAKIRYQEQQNKVNEYLLGHLEISAAAYLEGLVENAQNKFSFIQAVTDYDLALSSLSVTIGDPYYFEYTTAS